MNSPTLITDELQATLKKISLQDIKTLADSILNARRVFVAGAGRSGLMVKAFAMRLMHLGIQSYVIGETTTPSVQEDDLVIIGSGSGETASLRIAAQTTKSIGAQLAVVTIFPNSSVGKLADLTVRIPAPTPKSEDKIKIHSIQPMGSLFEQSLLLVLETIILYLMRCTNQSEAQMISRHANIE